MVFVFDLDDTLCDSDGYSEKYIGEFFKTHNMPYKLVKKNSRFAEGKFDWDIPTANAWYKKYGDQMMLEFPVFKGVKEFLGTLIKMGHKVVICTARSDDWHVNPVKITKDWVKNNQIPHSELIIGRKDKEKICEMVGADYFLDDDLDIVERVSKYFQNLNECDENLKKSNPKRQVFLQTTAYNKSIETPNSVIRVNSVLDLAKFIEI